MYRFWRTTALILVDLLVLYVAWALAFALTGLSYYEFFYTDWWTLLIASALAIGLNLCFKAYAGLLRFIGVMDMAKIMVSGFLTCIYFVFISYMTGMLNLQWAITCSVLYVPLLCAVRMSYRLLLSTKTRINKNAEKSTAKKVIVIGAGSAGATLLNEILSSNKLTLNPVCVLDDDEYKIGSYLRGVKIVGKIDDVIWAAENFKADEIFIAIPSLKGKRLKEIYELCVKTGCKVRTIPGIYQFANNSISVSKLKDVEIQDLLGRDPIEINLEEIMGYIKDRVVLVTGGGGSIGSELCRQIASHEPKQLIIVDIYENNAYEIQQELLRKHGNDFNLLVLIASVRDSKKMNDLFSKYKPEIVFHAAAHKHVPLMETSPNEAIKNNVSGTFKVADAAGRNGVKRFILISTDKAVNPTNIMGASKRICEMIIQAMNHKYETEYVAVRFGNVLGSNGSVIPLFKKQIAAGGPVTVTHKDIVRYFMTIPEAVSLVIQAGAYAKGGEIFVLDMGEQVRIYDLAEKLIRLSGLEPHKDIEIKVVGLRPGEKLYEERLIEEEGLTKTPNNLISIGKPIEFDEKAFFKKIEELYVEAYNETDKMKWLVHELVPTYKIDERS